MKINKDNYFKTVKGINLAKAPKIFQESHKLIVMKTDNGKDWGEYEKREDMHKIFDLTFKKLGELISSKGDELNGIGQGELYGLARSAIHLSNKIPEEIK